MVYDIAVEELPESRRKPLYTDPLKLGFGTSFTDHLFSARWETSRGWYDAKVGPYRKFEFDPATIVFHYGQEIFEGMKAYVGADDSVRLFRPELNIRRMNRSAARMCMPEMPEDMMFAAISKLVLTDRRWIPRPSGTALYIRPTMIATQVALGVKASDSYLFFVILSPVGPYFKEGFNPVSLYVSKEYVRAVRGGVGSAKTGGNYAASLLAGQTAREKGCSQVLWLDALNHEFVEEVGAMNIFFVFERDGKKVLSTPALTGSILTGITRTSVIQLAGSLGYPVEERHIRISEVLEGAKSGQLQEVFGTGTAAVISPVGRLVTDEDSVDVNGFEVGPVARHLYDELTGIQLGEREDRFDWVRIIGRSEPART